MAVAVIGFFGLGERHRETPRRSVMLTAGWAVAVFAAGAGLRAGARGSAGANLILIHLILHFCRRFFVRTQILTDEELKHYSWGELPRSKVVDEIGEGG
jgi:hypothetical protein